MSAGFVPADFVLNLPLPYVVTYAGTRVEYYPVFPVQAILPLISDHVILSRFKEGDVDAAANEFVRKYQRFVYATAQRYLRSSEDAYDASQEVFIRALKNIHKFRGDSSLSTWLYRITMNVCSSMKRKEKLRTFFSFDTIEPSMYSRDFSPEQVTENNEFEERFEHLLQQLPEKQRETFILRYFDELSYEEISQMLGTSVGGLKANYHQAVKKLAGHLSKPSSE